jgi:hypothetical protein
MDDDIRHLDLLGIFHFLFAALLAVCGLLPVFHLLFGLGILSGAFPGGGQGPPAFVGAAFTLIALFAILFSWGLALIVALAGRHLKDRTGYTFCIIVAAIECTMFPFGTALGIFTLIVLMRPSAKALFSESTPRSASS